MYFVLDANFLCIGYPALSRIDNKTEICSQCGTEEALRFFIYKSAEEKEKANS